MPAENASLPTPTVETTEPALEVALRKPRVWTVFATWFAAAIAGQVGIVAAFVAFGCAVGVMLGAQGADAAAIQARVEEMVQRPLPALFLTLIPFQLGMLAVAMLAARRSPEPFKQRLGLVPATGHDVSRVKLALMAAFTVAMALGTAIGFSVLLGATPAATPVASLINNGSWWTITLLSVILSVVPALVEEIVFRGYIQRRLLQRWSPTVAIGVSTLLFAVLHADSLQHIVAVVPLGIVTGLLAQRTNSVKPGMLLHAIHNTAAVGIGALGVALTPVLGEAGVGMLIIGLIVALGLAGLPVVVALVWNGQPRKESLNELEVESGLAQLLTDSGLASPAV